MIRYSLSVMTLMLCLLALPQKTLSQLANEDVVHLSDGSIIRGTIVQLSPNDSVAIQTVGGSQFNFSMNEVLKVTMSAMQTDKDLVYLNDGSIIRGSIVRLIPNDSLMIQTVGGSQFNFKMDEVLEVEMETTVQITIAPDAKPTMPWPLMPRRKDPGVAAGLSFVIPGLGQFYNEQPSKGFTVALIHVGAIVLMVAGNENDNEGLALIGALGFFANWLAATSDAYQSAKEINARLNRQSQLSISPIATPNRIGVLVSHQF